MADGTFQAVDSPTRGYPAFGWRRKLPIYLQTEATECALACLAMVAAYHGHDADVAGLRLRFSTSLKGVTLARVIEMARGLGFLGRPVRLELEEVTELKTPCILHWDFNHFVVLERASARSVIIHDPAQGVRKLTLDEFSKHFTGIALELTPGVNFTPIQAKLAVSLRALTGPIQGLGLALTQILLLALGLEVFSLVGPFYVQWVVDQVLVSADRDLLTLLGLGFLGVALFSVALTAARSWIVAWLGVTVNVQWASNLFSHLMRLPLDWFEKRHVGDIVSRFGSVQAIQRSLTSQAIGTLLDGIMSVVTLAVMGLYNVWLSLLVVVLFVIYGVFRWVFFTPLRQANEEQIVYGARQQSELLESIRGVVPVKLANKQSERLGRYINATVEAANRDITIQRLTIGYSAANQLLFGLGRVALVWVAAAFVLDKHLTVGMLIAFMAYADQFVSRSVGLVDKVMDFRMLRLHAERLADIALTKQEQGTDTEWSGPIPEACVELHNVSFRYGENEPWVIKGCSLRVDAGESVAIAGPSGCGKTTLAKLMLGLLEPTEGEVRFGGIDIRRVGIAAYRRWVSAVMQDDQLFAGSIAENISFFDPEISMEDVLHAAKLAAVHDDIMATPMAYQSLVGDMGSSLSGGQRQRVILARAFYRMPKVMILDEATSHLDVEREKSVNDEIRKMNITRVLIAHRAETLASADRVVVLSKAD